MLSVVSQGICYAVVSADDGPARLLIRHSAVDRRLDGIGVMAHIQMRLAIDVAQDIGGCPHRLFIAPEAAVVGVGAKRGPFNWVASHLAHRLGAPLHLAVHGPLVLHAIPGEDGWVGSLSDSQLRLLAELTRAFGGSIHGPVLTAAV